MSSTNSQPKASFFEPIKGIDKKLWVLWVSIIILLTVKIYQGDQAFFITQWGHNFEAGPLLNWYKWLYHHLATLLLLGLIPIVIIKAYLKDSLRDYGMTVGDWKFGLINFVVIAVLAIYPVYLSSQNPDHLEFYPLTSIATDSAKLFALWSLSYLPHYLGWEFFFRGYIGFGLKKHHGIMVAIMTQTLLTTLMHIGKPMGETWGAAIFGIYFGLLAYRTRSILWPLLIHWYLGILNSWFSGIA